MKTFFSQVGKLVGFFLLSSVACSVVLLLFLKFGYLQNGQVQPSIRQEHVDKLITPKWLFQRLAEQESEIALLKRQVSVIQRPKPRNSRSGAWIGVNILDMKEVTPERTEDQGIVVTSIVPGGPASRSELLAGDIVFEVEGQPIAGVKEFKNTLTIQEVGQAVHLSVVRDERILQVQLTPELWPK